MKKKRSFPFFMVSKIGKPLYLAVLFSLRLIFFTIHLIHTLRALFATRGGDIWEGQRSSFHLAFDKKRRQTDIFLQRRVFFLSGLRPKIQFFPRVTSTLLRKETIVFSSPTFAYRLLAIVHRWWVVVGFVLVVSLGLLSVSIHTYIVIFHLLPSPTDLRNHKPSLTTKIYDRNGVLLYKIYKEENRSLIRLSDLPSQVLNATVSIEDKDFFSHKGVSVSGIIRAAKTIFTGQGFQGGSTITQQLVKTVLLTPERTLVRKLKEAIIAIRVERSFSKQEILEMYLNEVSYGGSTYGIEEASRAYFDIPAKELTIAQSAFLAGLPQAPSLYNPFGSYPERGLERQHEVLRRMFEDGKISAIQLEQAKSEKLVFSTKRQDIKAPHFVMYVREQLAREYGETAVSSGGLEIYTTLDLALQEKVQEIVRQEVDSLEKLHVTNGASVVTNPKTGEILAMVGSTNFFDKKNDGQVNVTVRERQPGSSIKPVTYVSALERGFSPTTVIDDSPIAYSVPGSPVYVPKNYDGKYHGKVTLRSALANSYNIPAVKVESAVGLNTVIEKGRQLGITTWNQPQRYGLSLTLGGAEVKMVDMAVVYGTFANQGVTVPLQSIRSIRTPDGRVLFKNPCIDTSLPCGGVRTTDARIAYQMTNILMDNTARSPAFGSRSVLTIPDQQVAVKTGTTNLLRDNWTNGYTSDRVVVVWVGNNDNSPMSRITSGIIGASPIWNKIISLSLSKSDPHIFPIPEGLVASTICRQNGSSSCGGCVSTLTEYFLPGTGPNACPRPNPEIIQNPLSRDRILEGIAVSR